MKSLVYCRNLLGAVFLSTLTLLSVQLSAQTTYKSNAVNAVIIGDSNIHEWEMNSSKGTANASVTTNSSGTLQQLSNIQFSIAAETLKSGKSQMDKNTYKALDTKTHPNITFSGSNATIENKGNNKFSIRSKGKLSISGNVKDVELVANAQVNADKSISIEGSYSFNMTEYKVTPPTIMLGTIKVYDPLTIRYNLVMKP